MREIVRKQRPASAWVREEQMRRVVKFGVQQFLFIFCSPSLSAAIGSSTS